MSDSQVRKGTRPLYVQLLDVLSKKILENGMNASVPSETELMEEFKVSRHTVRHALSELERQGLIIKRQGRKSTIPFNPPLREYAQEVISFTEEMNQKGMKASSSVLDFKIIQADSKLATYMGVQLGEEFVLLDRVRYGNDEPINLVLSCIPYRLCPGILRHDFNLESLYEVLEKEYRLDLALATRTLEAIMPTPREANLLGISYFTPLLLMEGVSFLANGKPVEFFQLKFRGDKSKFMVKVFRKK
ncbi:MAG: GntR family transcriptional regulator [Candidatus Atribacteria bacterium]|nr:GntR family transcriptional regulator [Candidatus Atribacteria bacterium]